MVIKSNRDLRESFMFVSIKLEDPAENELFTVSHEVPDTDKVQKIYRLIWDYWYNNTHIYLGSASLEGGCFRLRIAKGGGFMGLKPSDTSIANAKQFVEDVFDQVLRGLA